MNKNFYKYFFMFLGCVLFANDSHAWEYSSYRFGLKLNGYGTGGFLEQVENNKSDFVGDWRLRGQMNYAVYPGQSLGLVYALDAAAVDEDKYMREFFSFWEFSSWGRVEFGFTDSVARKLGVGIPDVGGLRVNDKPLFYKKILPAGPVISDTVLTTGRSALRASVVSLPTNLIQYGLSIAGITDDYDFAIDGAMKVRQSKGKIKSALSLGASFMDKPNNYTTDSYTPVVTADWRAQLSAGANVQYNSWLLGISTRIIYDEAPQGIASDGIAFGAGLSYDVLKYSMSISYIFSDTGIWHKDMPDYQDHTVVGSMRYKYSEYLDGWTSIGITTKTPFVSAGLRITF